MEGPRAISASITPAVTSTNTNAPAEQAASTIKAATAERVAA
jgi:hypothetical protein